MHGRIWGSLFVLFWKRYFWLTVPKILTKQELFSALGELGKWESIGKFFENPHPPPPLEKILDPPWFKEWFLTSLTRKFNKILQRPGANDQSELPFVKRLTSSFGEFPVVSRFKNASFQNKHNFFKIRDLARNRVK